VFLAGGIRLSALGTSVSISPIVPASDDGWWVWSSRWNENWKGKPKYHDNTGPIATSATTNPIGPAVLEPRHPRWKADDKLPSMSIGPYLALYLLRSIVFATNAAVSSCRAAIASIQHTWFCSVLHPQPEDVPYNGANLLIALRIRREVLGWKFGKRI
jgi:hypothetical protein